MALVTVVVPVYDRASELKQRHQPRSHWQAKRQRPGRPRPFRCESDAVCYLDGRRRGLAVWSFGLAIALAALFLIWGCWTYGPLRLIGLPTPRYPAEVIFAFALLYAGIIGLVVLHSGSRWLRPRKRHDIVDHDQRP